MSSLMYEASVSVFDRMLSSLDKIIDKGVAHTVANDIAPETLLEARLFPDMYPFTTQVQIAADFAKGASARLAGVEVPSVEDNEKSFGELKDRIAWTLSFIRSLDPASFGGSETRTVTWQRRSGPLTTDGSSYLFLRALPNFYFHVTTAYDLLRHNGVDIGKRDFLGTARVETAKSDA